MDTTPLQYEHHRQRWDGCRRCPLGCVATNHVLGRGDMPADVLYIGTAPGRAEDKTGQPFIGFVGRMLNAIHRDAFPDGWSRHYTNLLACRPTEDGETSTPNRSELDACRPRTTDLIRIIQPRCVVFVSALAETELVESLGGIPSVLIPPLGRMVNGRNASPEYRDAVDRINGMFNSIDGVTFTPHEGKS